VRRAVPIGALALVAACSAPPPARVSDAETAARLDRLQAKVDGLHDQVWKDGQRFEALERRGGGPPSDADARARIALLESRVATLEDEVTLLRARLGSGAPRGEAPRGDAPPRVSFIEGQKGRELPAAPEPGEVVRPFAALDGECFSFARGRSLDLARLVGIEAPTKPGLGDADAEKATLERQTAAWGASVESGEAWRRARERLEELLQSGDLSFAYEATGSREATGRGRLLVWAHVKKDGVSTCVNDALVREGLALARGENARSKQLAALEDEARREKRGLFAGSR
jgi:hypothetical protein